MDEFYEYWELIPENEKYEVIGQEIVRYKRNLQDVTSRDLSENVIQFFQEKLLSNPYPTYFLMYHIIDIKDHEKNQLIEEIIFNTIMKLIDLIIEHPQELDKQFKLFNLLSNVFISDYGMSKIQDVIIPSLYELKESRKLLDDASMYFALLSRNSLSMLRQYLDYEHSRLLGKFDNRAVFLKCYYQKQHWIHSILNQNNCDALKIAWNEKLFNTIQACKLVLKMNSKEKDNIWTDIQAIDSSVINNKILSVCLMEATRLYELSNFLKAHSNNFQIDATKSHVMTQLLKQHVVFSVENYDSILEILKRNHELNLMQAEKYGWKLHETKTEMQLFNEYMIVKTYLMSILFENKDDCLTHVRSLLKTINDGNVLYRLIQTVLSLLFLRYDHIRKTRIRRKANEFNSSDSAVSQNINNISTDDVHPVFIDSFNNSGFVCSKRSLENILNSLKIFLMSMDINEAYKNYSHDLKDKFTNVLRCVDKGLWKLSIINEEPTLVESTRTFDASREWISIHDNVNCSIISPEKMSDDEKQSIKSNRSVRKKIRKKSKLSHKFDERDEESDREIFHHSGVTENSENRVKIENIKKHDNIIEKMLMSPESMIALCVQRNDFESAQKIIQEYNLKDSPVEREIEFIQLFDDTMHQLRSVTEKYEEKQNSADIKNSAEVGFEVAKLTDILEKFCASKKLIYAAENSHLIESVLPQYPHFSPYQKQFVTMTTLIDFMISISKYDLNMVISRFILKKWNFAEGERKHFFYNLIQILSTLRKTELEVSISSLFNNEIYCLDPTKFEKSVRNRRNLSELLKIDLKQLNDDSMFDEILMRLDEFPSEINYIQRIINYAKNIRLLAKFHTNDFLNVNHVLNDLCVFKTIGKIIYVQQYKPDLLTSFCYNANINLPHAIAVAGVGKIAPPVRRRTDDEKLLSLFHLHQTEPKANEVNLQVSTSLENVFELTNTDILHYIKKSGSFLVAYLLKEAQNYDLKTLRYDEPNFFERMKSLTCIDKLKQLYNQNIVLTVLNYDQIDLKKFLMEIDKLELSEKLKMLACITEKSWNKHRAQFNELKDAYIEMLIETKSHSTLELLKQVGNVRKFNELLLKHIREITDDTEVERLLGWSLYSENLKEIGEEQRKELEQWVQKLKVYQKIFKLYSADSDNKITTWLDVLQLAENDTCALVNYLMNVNVDFHLCYELLKLHPLLTKSEEVYTIFIDVLNNKNLNNQHGMLFQIIRTLPSKIVSHFFGYSLNHIVNLQSMKTILQDLVSRDSPPKKARLKYQKFQLSCKIIEAFDPDDNQLWLLAAYPLIIIEQALMNSKIEVLSTIVKDVRIFLKDQPSCNLCSTASKSYQVGEILVYDFNSHHEGMLISNDCIDFLLKIYAAKALDFQIVDINSQLSNTSGNQSIESVQSKIFQMPKDAPTKDLWVPDNEAFSCMCCKKSKFSLLNRRHHCRRCGRVTCADCTRNRVVLPELYGDLMVRCCDDCFGQIEDEKRKIDIGPIEKARSADIRLDWRLTGDLQVDQMIRDEFVFEYSPNVSLCIAIICLHTINEELTSFLLFHCHRLQLLLRPIHGKINPEIDIILVAKMLKNLATTAKLFGDMGESNLIIDHADMILKIAENDCDYIISKATFNDMTFNISIREVINELIKSENWKLAIELAVKYDRNSKSGIFSAWAVSLIKGGQYKLAREKIALALQPVAGSSSKSSEQLLAAITSSGPIYPLGTTFKRPSRSSPLLYEIIEVIESCVPKHSIMTASVASLSSSRLNTSSPKIGPLDSIESNLKKIMEGDYGGMTRRLNEKFDWNQGELLKSHYYEEAMHYLLNYGGNADLFDFFMRNNLIRFALRYTLLAKVSYDMFIQFVFVPVIKAGRLTDFIDMIKQIDERFKKSKSYILAVCKYLERKKSLHVLYQLQLALEDYIRAALTSLKFYLSGAGNYNELNEKARHLIDAKNHLQTALERVESESDGSGVISDNDIQLKWDIKNINAQINIILLQLEVSKYLANCELSGLPTLDLMSKIFMDKISLKTLLGKQNEKNQVAILLLICGQSIESAFGLSYRIIQECSLLPSKIYTTCTKYLARDLKRLIEVERLISCIKTNASSAENAVDPETERMCDELIAMAVEIAYTQHQSDAKIQIDQLIKHITSKTMKIQCYLNSNQLKTAFVNCAALPDNLDYIKRIMRQAEITRQENIRRLCEKKLQQSMSSSMSGSIGSMNDKFSS